MKRCKSTFFRFFLHMSQKCCNFAAGMTNTQDIAARLRTVYSPSEALELTRWIQEECGTAKSRIHGETDADAAVERLLRGEPVQYVFEHALWMGLDLRVTPVTLIPRPETAELIEAAEAGRRSTAKQIVRSAAQERKVEGLKLLDIGTGSGCIAIALKQRHPEWTVSACDISKEALTVAQENARRNHAEVRFFRCDILHEVPENGPFDCIVSNPPYVLESEKTAMESRVLDYEPASALFVPDQDPLRFYRRITDLAAGGLLGSGGQLLFEINERFGAETADLLREKGLTDVEILLDMFGKPRFVKGVRP